jgi:hypothetical protein
MSTKPMKSTKYNIFHASRYEYPTRIISNGKEGTLVIGHKEALRKVEKTIGRSLLKGTKIRVRGGNWAFYEPKAAA